MIKEWARYLKERFPLPVYVLLVGGLVWSGQWLGGGAIAGVSLAMAFVAILVFFSELRLMDELKDYRKDLIAHPERPLPRRLLTVQQVRTMIGVQMVLLVSLCVVLAVLFNFVSAMVFGVVCVWLWLMYKEFYVGERLGKFPLLYAVSHQIILLPLCLFPVVISRPELLQSSEAWMWALSVLGAFFTYEVSRKLDPKAHPILQTYLSVYGPQKTWALIAVLSMVAAAGAWGFGLWKVLFVFEGLVLLSAGFIVFKPERYKIIEGLATLSLLVHLYAGVIQKAMGN